MPVMRKLLASKTIVYRDGDRLIRLLISDLSCHAFKSEVNLRMSGRCYRKNGLLGKRFEARFAKLSATPHPKRGRAGGTLGFLIRQEGVTNMGYRQLSEEERYDIDPHRQRPLNVDITPPSAR